MSPCEVIYFLILIYQLYVAQLLLLFKCIPCFFKVLQIFRVIKSEKIETPGYCLAISHDIDDLEILNHASKADVLRVRI